MRGRRFFQRGVGALPPLTAECSADPNCLAQRYAQEALMSPFRTVYTPPEGYTPPGTENAAVKPESKGLLYIGLGVAALVLGAGAVLLFSEER